jgi:hypothetical protein
MTSFFPTRPIADQSKTRRLSHLCSVIPNLGVFSPTREQSGWVPLTKTASNCGNFPPVALTAHANEVRINGSSTVGPLQRAGGVSL